MTKFKNNYIFTALLISIILLTAMCTCAFWLKAEDQSANAEYIDILNDGNAVVNFNQLIVTQTYSDSSISTNGYEIIVTGSWSSQFAINNGGTFTFIPTHKYYVLSNLDSALTGIGVEFSLGISTGGQFDIYKRIITNSSTSITRVRCYNMPNGTYYIGLIDLTQMFGIGNEPNISQCSELFIANYYSYNTGTPMLLNGFEYYSKGVTDTYSNLDLDVVNYSAFSSAYIVSELSGSFPETFIERHVDYEVLDVPFLKARGVLAVPFNSIVSSGSLIKFKYIDPSMGGSGYYLWCGIYYNNSFVPIMRIDSEDTPVDSDGYITFTCPFDTQNLLFCESSSSSEFIMVTSAFWLGDLQVQNAKMGDIKVLIDSASQDAIRERDEYWQRYYGQYGQGYQNIYNSGYNAGVNADAQNFAEKYYTFPQFLGALFDVPVQTLTALLDFNVFGFNLKNFVFSLLTLAIIFALIKLILVKTGDK